MRNQVVHQAVEITTLINQASFPCHCRVFLTAPRHFLEQPHPSGARVSLRKSKGVCVCVMRLFCLAGE